MPGTRSRFRSSLRRPIRRRGRIAVDPTAAVSIAMEDEVAEPTAVELEMEAAAAEATVASAPKDAAGTTETIRVVCLQEDELTEWEGDEAIDNLARVYAETDARIWIDLCGASPSLAARVSRILGLHPLLAEDMVERDQRAKLEQVEDDLHLVLFSLGWDDGRIYDRELDFVLGERFLLSSHSRWWDPRATRLLRLGARSLLRRGPDYLLWALADDVIDNYFPILDRLGDEIDDLEDQVVSRADRLTLERLFSLKRELIQVRRVTAPEREMFNRLSSRETDLISRAHALYYRDAYDHLIRLTDELDTYRELVSATVDAYLSTVNNNLSFIMKRLTGVTVILAGIGAIGGLFGMSEAPAAISGSEGYGFWIVVVVTVLAGATALALLRKIDWI